MNQEIMEKVIEILESNGIEINDQQELVELTSLQYISSLVCMEDIFNMEFPDEFLVMDSTPNIESFVSVIEKQIKDQFT